MIPTFWIAWIAVRELLFEKVFYLLLGFGLMSLGVSLALGQLTYTEQSKLTLDFMLAGIEFSMILFSVFMGISLFQKEMTVGSVSMVLSKPISRTSFLLGKFLGQLFTQGAVIVAMGVVSLLIISRFQGFVPSYPALIEALILIFAEIAVLSAITYFFSVNAGAITTALATLCLFGLGHLNETLSKGFDASSFETHLMWRGLSALTPDFQLFNIKSLASYGESIPWMQVGWACLYATCCVTFFISIAALTFSRKDVFT